MANTAITSLQLNSGDVHYITFAFGTCTTAAATAAKVVTVDTTKYDFALVTGVRVAVLFSSANTSTTVPTLNVNDTGAKRMTYRNNNSIKGTYSWKANDIIEFIYDGLNWEIIGGYNTPPGDYIEDVTGVNAHFGLLMSNTDDISTNPDYLWWNPAHYTLYTQNLRVPSGIIYFGDDDMKIYADGGNCIYFTDGEEAGYVELDGVIIPSHNTVESGALDGPGITSNDSSLATNRLRASKIYPASDMGATTAPSYNGSITWYYD